MLNVELRIRRVIVRRGSREGAELRGRHCHRGDHDDRARWWIANTAAETARLLRARFEPQWASRDIRTLTRSDVIAILDTAVKAKTPSAANHALSAIRKFFSWCLERDFITANPCAGISRPAPLGARERALTIEEIAVVWEATSLIGYPFESVVKLLILTAQRRGEVAGMAWREIDFEKALWTIGRDMPQKGTPEPL